MACLQRYVWAELGKLDTLIVDVVLDELIRSAMDAGINSIRCETIANIIASLSSISVRGRLLSRLRKVRLFVPLTGVEIRCAGCHQSVSNTCTVFLGQSNLGRSVCPASSNAYSRFPVSAACSQSAVCPRSRPYRGSGSGLGLHYCSENGLWNHYEPFAGALFRSH